MSKLYADYLKTKYTNKEQTYNFLSLSYPKGRFTINKDDLEKVYKLIDGSYKDKKVPSLVQKPDEISAITIDIDLRQDIDKIERIYDETLFKKIQDNCKYFIEKNLSVMKDDIQMFVFEKSSPVNKKGKVKDGIHIMFPYIHIDSAFKINLYMELESAFEGYFEELGYLPEDQIFDRRTIKTNCWQVYGCAKPECEDYKLTHIYDFDFDKKPIPKSRVEIMKITSVFTDTLHVKKYKNDKIQKKINDNVKLDDNKKIKEIVAKSNNKELINNKVVKYILKKRQTSVSDKDITYAKNLTLRCLGSKYYDDYGNWFNIGIALHNISPKLKETWHEFSKKSSKYNENECDELWEKFNYMDSSMKLTLGSIIYWSQTENPEEFEKVREKYTAYSVENMKTKTANSVGKAFCDMYGDKFVCADLKNDRWFKFDNHKWVEDMKGVSVRRMMSNEFSGAISKIASNYSLKAISETDDDEKVKFLNKSKIYNEIAIKLQQTAFKSNVLKEISEYLYQPDFIENLDTNKALLCFLNGVYDLDNLEFRDGLPCDYISKCTNIDYVSYEMIKNNEIFAEIVNEVYEMIENIHPNDEIRNYVLNMMASVLHGLMKEQKFHIWTGTGSNGKSMLIDFLKNVLGDYAEVLKTSILTAKRGSSASADPELVKTKGVRFCILQEPEEGDVINTGTMKELSGGDDVTARGLFCNPIRFKPQFTLVMTCNHLPQINTNDGGTWRRINVVEFKTKFCNNPKDDMENERKADMSLLTKVGEKVYKEALMSILINQFKQYSKYGIKEPCEVVKFTKQYQERSDFYDQFITECIEKTEDKKDVLKITEVYSKFTLWFKIECPSQKIPRRVDLKKQLEDKLGFMQPQGWKYMRMKTEDDDETDEDTDDETSDEE